MGARMITKEEALNHLKDFEKKFNDILKSEKDRIFSLEIDKLTSGKNTIESIREKRAAIKKEQLFTAANYLCSPSKFKEILDTYQWDWSDESNYVYNESDHILKYSDLVEQEDEFGYLLASTELQMIAICVDPNNFKFIKERPITSLDGDLDRIFEGVDKFGFTLPPPEWREKDYQHESGLNKELLINYFEDLTPDIYFVIVQLFKNKEIRSSKEIIYKVFTNISGNEEDWKDNCISILSKELLDDENFLLDLANILRGHHGLPYYNASNRIKKDKGIAMKACAISGYYIDVFDEEFLKDRDVAIVAVTRSPNVINRLDKTLQDDELLIKLSKS